MINCVDRERMNVRRLRNSLLVNYDFLLLRRFLIVGLLACGVCLLFRNHFRFHTVDYVNGRITIYYRRYLPENWRYGNRRCWGLSRY